MPQWIVFTEAAMLAAAVALGRVATASQRAVLAEGTAGTRMAKRYGTGTAGGAALAMTLLGTGKGERRMDYLSIARDLAKDTEALKELRENNRKEYSAVKAAVEEEAKHSGISCEAERILAPSELRAAARYFDIDNEGLDPHRVEPEVELSRMVSPDRFLSELNYERPIEEIVASVNRYAANYSKAGGKTDVATLRERAMLNRNKHIDAHYEILDDLSERNVTRADAAQDRALESYVAPELSKVQLLDDTMEPDYEPTL